MNARWRIDDECEVCVLLGVFTRHLGPDDEPDREGVEAASLLGRIEMQRRGYRQP